MLLSKDLKGLAAFWTKAKCGKTSIEGRDPINTEAPHYSEAGAVEDGKILITPQETTISQATSRSAKVTASITATTKKSLLSTSAQPTPPPQVIHPCRAQVRRGPVSPYVEASCQMVGIVSRLS